MAVLISNNKLWSILESDENDRLDFKSADLLLEPNGENRYKIAKHIVGFSNHRGGQIVFGVDDAGEPEGADLAEEKCLGTISEIISQGCSPTIDFSHEFYSETRGDLSEGSILILRISEKASPPPVAIVENSDGKVRKREYRVRSGESTRLVSDGELLSLFNQEYQLELENKTEVWFTHNNDLTPVVQRSFPAYHHSISEYYEDLEENQDEIMEVLDKRDDEMMGYGLLFSRILCVSILTDLFTLKKENLTEALEGSKERDIDDLGYEFSYKSIGDIDLPEGDEIFEVLPLDIESEIGKKRDRFPEGWDIELGLYLPEDASVTVEDDFRRIEIAVEDEFEFQIRTQIQQVVSDYPEDHPQSIGLSSYLSVPTHPEGITDPSEIPSVFSIESNIVVQAEFEYPTQSHQQYRTSQALCENIISRFETIYNWDEFIDSLPDKKFFDIEEKLDRIEQKVDQMCEGESKSE